MGVFDGETQDRQMAHVFGVGNLITDAVGGCGYFGDHRAALVDPVQITLVNVGVVLKLNTLEVNRYLKLRSEATFFDDPNDLLVKNVVAFNASAAQRSGKIDVYLSTSIVILS